MSNLEAFLEKTWNGLLSRESELIQQTYLSLDTNNQRVVLEHLKKMTSETGWHPEQVTSARAALDAITAISKA
jgi:hypothetical protein